MICRYHANAYLFAREAGSHKPLRIQVGWTQLLPPGYEISTKQYKPFPNPHALLWSVIVKRSTPVKIYALFVTISIGLVSASVSGITLLRLNTEDQRVNGAALLLAALFGCTQLRSTLPNLPSNTGTVLDYYGNLLALVLLSTSMMSLAVEEVLHLRWPLQTSSSLRGLLPFFGHGRVDHPHQNGGGSIEQRVATAESIIELQVIQPA